MVRRVKCKAKWRLRICWSACAAGDAGGPLGAAGGGRQHSVGAHLRDGAAVRGAAGPALGLPHAGRRAVA